VQIPQQIRSAQSVSVSFILGHKISEATCRVTAGVVRASVVVEVQVPAACVIFATPRVTAVCAGTLPSREDSTGPILTSLLRSNGSVSMVRCEPQIG
jgi:hypothetical protein